MADDEDDMAKVMGFSNFGGPKQAKQFDFMAMFEEARNTAIERNKDSLGSRDEEDPVHVNSPKNFPQGPHEVYKKQSGIQSRSKPLGPIPSSSNVHGDTGSESDDDDLIGPPLPSSMRITNMKDIDEDDDLIGPPLPPSLRQDPTKGIKGEDDSDEEDMDDDNPLEKIPSSHEVVLDHGDRVVSALSLDPSGARLVTGGYDYDMKFWDFAGMDKSLRSFRTLRPCECHQIRSLEYSTTGDTILVVAGNAQAKVIDRDGFEVLECCKGDQYIYDKAKTKGHTAMLNYGCWHPKIREEFLTCSNDGTLRTWDINNAQKKHKALLKPRSSQGRMCLPTTCTYSRDGRLVASACQDGSIQMWQHNRYVNISLKNMNAHANGTDTSCLCFSYDGRCLASRGGDDTVKLWDIRQFKKPVVVAENLPNVFPMTDVAFSPDDKLVITGLSVRKGEGAGKLLFMDRQTLKTMSELEVSEDSSVVRCLWHPKLNQIVVSCADGNVKIYYDPDKSHRGAKLSVVKTMRKTRQVQMMIADNIITPHALPMFRKNKPMSTRKQEEKARQDPIQSHRPDLPMAGPGQGGRVANKGATLSQYVVQQIVLRKPDDRDKDPRAAILRHAKDAAENPYWVDPAYKKTQPHAIFQEDKSSDEDDDEVQPVWKKSKMSQ